MLDLGVVYKNEVLLDLVTLLLDHVLFVFHEHDQVLDVLDRLVALDRLLDPLETLLVVHFLLLLVQVAIASLLLFCADVLKQLCHVCT